MTNQENIKSRGHHSIVPIRDTLMRVEVWCFTERRIRFYAWGTLVAYTISLIARSLRQSWIFHPDGKPSCIDFSHMWVSGSLAGSANPDLVYDASAFSAARAGLAGVDACMSGI